MSKINKIIVWLAAATIITFQNIKNALIIK